MGSKIGLFGGTFDPPHLGHLILAQRLQVQAGLDRVIFIPAGQPPHKLNKTITPAEHRLNMLRQAVANNPKFFISDWELGQSGPCYTINTVRHFQQAQPEDMFYWLIGSDTLAELPTWHQVEELIAAVDILTGGRGGVPLDRVLEQLSKELSPAAFRKLKGNIIRTPLIEISSSEIRDLVSRGREIRYFVPKPVEEYIRKEGLYR